MVFDVFFLGLQREHRRQRAGKTGDLARRTDFKRRQFTVSMAVARV